ncbi:RHS repeat-associated protein [Mucilaginibacter sp. UYNi724]
MLVNHIYNIRIIRLLVALFLIFASISLRAQTQVTSPMTTTPAAGDYFSYTGITLSPEFSFTAGAGQSFRAYIANADCQPLVTTASANQNYIMTSVPRQPGINPLATGLSTCDMMRTVQYFDGLGRPLQTVQVQGSPLGKDIVLPVIYDQFGREAVKYLPYASSGNDGSYKATAVSDQLNFYHPTGTAYTTTQLAGGIAHIPTPYAQTGFEASPLNRVLEQGAAGDAWQLTGTVNPSGVSSGHTVKIDYTTNNTTALSTPATSYYAALYTISAISATDQKRTLTLGNGTTNAYNAGELHVTVSKDENWTSTNGKAGTTEEYKDKEGRVVLKRTFNLPSGSSTIEVLSTYYVYDDLGNLAYVLPPKSNADNALPTQTTLDALCYQYRYDERNRLTQKRLPGKGWEFIVYNALDQVVATQDANQRNKIAPEWVVNHYDAMGRVVVTGIYNYGTTGADVRATVQGQATANTTLWETPTGTPLNYGYTTASFPTAINTILTVNYYDNYTFAGTNPYAYAAGSSMTTGLPTGSLTNVLGTTNMLWSVTYYDDKGRSIETFKQHYLRGGTASLSNYDETTVPANGYNFNNQLTASTRKHYTTASTTTPQLTIVNTYDYDHMGRKVNTFEKINTGANILLARNDYNEIGQLMTKHLHGATGAAPFLQDIDYAYNERGWLSKINDPAKAPATNKLFAEQLNYNTPQYGSVAQYNGNIAEQAYQVYNSPTIGTQTVKYVYDQLNRLTDGTSSTGYSETGIGYDLSGNIQTLTRATAPNAASLGYTYSGNQLTTVNNSGAAFRSYGYDPNGNATSDGQGNAITYNMFNLPQAVTSKGLAYTYDAGGNKLRKVSATIVTEYIGGIQYAGTVIDFIQTEEGRAINSAGSYKYEYTITDHLGNSRVTFDQTSPKVGEDDYYPFGLNVHRGPFVSPKNNYLYNKKELQEELSQYDYGARFYDPVIGRMNSIDPHASSYVSWSPYSYVADNPITSIDPDGRDLIVLSAPDHVYGLGHAAVLIGNDKTGYNYYSKNGTTEGGGASGASNKGPVSGRHYASLKEFEASADNKKDGPYKTAYDIKTDEATDKKMEAAAAASVKADYDVLLKSCIDVASDALKAAQKDPGTTNLPWWLFPTAQDKAELTPVPNTRFKNIMQNNPGGIFIVLPQPKKERTGTVTVDPAEITHTVIPDKKP